MAIIAGHQELCQRLVEAILGPGQKVSRLVLVINVDDVVRAYVERVGLYPEEVALEKVALALEDSPVKPVVEEARWKEFGK